MGGWHTRHLGATVAVEGEAHFDAAPPLAFVRTLACSSQTLLASKQVTIPGAHTLFEPGEAGAARANPHSNPVVCQPGIVGRGAEEGVVGWCTATSLLTVLDYASVAKVGAA